MRFGAIINAAAIVASGFAGMFIGKYITENIKETVMRANGCATVVIAISGALAKILVVTEDGISTQGSVMMVVCIALGAIVGELLHIEDWLERFGAWLKEKSGNSGNVQFIDAFVTTTVIVGVGAMAIVGSIEDGINGNMSILLVKTVLDIVIVLVLSSTLGIGCMFSAIPVLVLEGGMTILAGLLAPFMTTPALNALSLVGNVLILGVGINLIWPKTIRVANLLPAMIFTFLWAAFNLPMT